MKEENNRSVQAEESPKNAEKRSFGPAEMLAPTPAVMVSCGNETEKDIITIAWTGIINSEPPMTYVSVRPSRFSHHLIEETGEFVINCTTEELAYQTDWCGVRSGREVDKFREMKLTPEAGEAVSCPMIRECPINLECRVTEVRRLGSHDMFLAEIVKVHVSEELIDENGKIDYGKAGILAYLHGEYYGMKKNPIGRFGFSVMKPKTKRRISKEEHQKRVEKNRKKRQEKK